MAILNQQTGELSVVGSATEDMFSGGWGPDGRAITMASVTYAKLWRFRPVMP
jgi:hypothetical protein